MTETRQLKRGESLQQHLQAKASEYLAPEFKKETKPDPATDPIGVAVDALAARQPERRQPRNVEDSVRLAFRETAATPAVDLTDLSDEELNERAEALNAEAERRELKAWEAEYGSLDTPLAETEETEDLDLDPEMIALQDAEDS